MFFSPRIRLKALANLCRRLAVSTSAGIQDRKIWRDEAARSRGSEHAALSQVSDSLARGETISDALSKTGEYLPRMFKQIVAIGDASGRLDHAYQRLAEHYEQTIVTQRMFLAALAWPMIQLAIALFVIGIVIWISGFLNLKNFEGDPLDMFGLGLVGGRGLALYVAFITFAIIAVIFVVEASRRGMLWTRQLQRNLIRLPAIGGAVQTLALARFTWSMQLILDTSMDLRKALPLALDATGNDYYRRLGPEVANGIQRGMTLTAALADTGAFPRDLLDAIAVGEQTGMLSETMQRQSTEYQRRAALAISVIAQIFGYLIWALVAAMIVVLIFRVMGPYIGMIEDLSKPNAFK
ncbi:MAG: type II secretion system F family protein [Planctomycetaceae bacterium]|nr:type II secretion system F family protein [Planctomycetaceae bacterium]